MNRLGLRLEGDLAPSNLLEHVRHAESAGFHSIWLPGGDRSPVQIAWLAAATDKIRFGTGIMPVYYRTPTLVAETAAALDLLSNQRFILGLGAGNQASVEGSHGVPFEQPLQRVLETVVIVKRLLAAKPVDYAGNFHHLRGATIGLRQPANVSVYVAGYGPKMLQMGGELAEGVLLSWPSPQYLAYALENVRMGATRAGRDPSQIEVAGYVRVAVTNDVEKVQVPLARLILSYVKYPFPRRMLQRSGFSEEIEAVDAALSKGDQPATLKAISAKMRNALAICGPPAYCRAEIEKLRARGLTLPVVAPFISDEASVRATIDAFAG